MYYGLGVVTPKLTVNFYCVYSLWNHNPMMTRGGNCYALTGHSSQREASWSGVGSGLSALATCDADMW